MYLLVTIVAVYCSHAVYGRRLHRQAESATYPQSDQLLFSSTNSTTRFTIKQMTQDENELVRGTFRERRHHRRHPCEKSENRMAVNGRIIKTVECFTSTTSGCSSSIGNLGSALCKTVYKAVYVRSQRKHELFASSCRCY